MRSNEKPGTFGLRWPAADFLMTGGGGTNKSDWLEDSYSIKVLVKESEDLVMLPGSFTCWEGL